MTPTTPDVLVVGLGPAGARAAEACARAGLSTVALERRASAGTPVQCAEFIPALLDQELPGLEAFTAQRVRRMLTYVEAEAADEMPNFHGRMIDRAAFDAALAAAAAAAGAHCRYGVGALSVAADGTVRTSAGDEIRPRVLIGADGPRSKVARAIGAASVEQIETRQITVRLLVPHDATDIFLRAEMTGGYGWLFPKGAVANLGLGVAWRARALLGPLLDGLHRELMTAGRVGSAILSRTGGPIPAGGRVTPHGLLDRTTVLLAGDAAGLANPITGAGIAAAVMSGRLAGEAAARRVAGDMAAPQTYEDELSAIFDVSLSRALRRRAELMDRARSRPPAVADWHRAWVAFGDYWAA
jgi:digeranylgeranylglycerophospholipid reductase